jgi:hypothetical protein
MLEKIKQDMMARLSGAEVKRAIIKVQFLSAVLFILVSTTLVDKSFPLAFLFLTEGVGQFLISYDNKLQTKDYYRYFTGSGFSYAGYFAFSLTMFTRFYIFFQLWPELFIIPILFSILVLVSLWPSIFSSSKRDEIAMVLIVLSSFMLAIGTFMAGDTVQSGFQLAYGTLLILGVVFMDARTAELLNIAIWCGFFWLVK